MKVLDQDPCLGVYVKKFPCLYDKTIPEYRQWRCHSKLLEKSGKKETRLENCKSFLLYLSPL